MRAAFTQVTAIQVLLSDWSHWQVWLLRGCSRLPLARLHSLQLWSKDTDPSTGFPMPPPMQTPVMGSVCWDLKEHTNLISRPTIFYVGLMPWGMVYLEFEADICVSLYIVGGGGRDLCGWWDAAAKNVGLSCQHDNLLVCSTSLNSLVLSDSRKRYRASNRTLVSSARAENCAQGIWWMLHVIFHPMWVRHLMSSLEAVISAGG